MGVLYVSNVLELSRILDVRCFSQSDIPYVSLPYFNGISIFDFEKLKVNRKIYYGDEIDLHFWKMLGLSMGSSYEPGTIYTLESNYKYIYIPDETTFTIYDGNGTVIFENKHIHSIFDLSIDFLVHKSHQFEIHLGDMGNNKDFFRVANLSKHFHNGIIDNDTTGVQNTIEPDRVRPYAPSDSDNPSWDIKHLAYIDAFGDLGNIFYDDDDKPNPYDPSNPGPNIGGNPMNDPDVPIHINIGGNYDIDWSKLKPENNFYAEGLLFSLAKNMWLTCNGKTLDNQRIMLPLLSMGLYPLLNNVQLAESIYNNRPVYEPWLIWKLFEFINTGYSKDIPEEFLIPVFDLSPQFN